MSKSLGTGVGLDLNAKDMFFKIMQLADAGIYQCFVDCTRLPMSEIAVIKIDSTTEKTHAISKRILPER